MRKWKIRAAAFLTVFALILAPFLPTGAASQSAPLVSKKTLYVGGENYKIERNNPEKGGLVRYSSSDTGIATVTQEGVICPVAPGKAIITAEVSQGGSTDVSEITVTVKEPYVAITDAVHILKVGDTYSFQGKGVGFAKPVLKWKVSSSQYAKINADTGELTALAEGNLRVYYKETATGKYGVCRVQIVADEAAEDSEKQALTEVVYDDGTECLMYQGIYYKITGDKEVKAVDYYDLEMTEIKIPNKLSYHGMYYRITEIGEDAFAGLSELKKAAIGNYVVSIGERAFHSCSELKKLKLGTGLEKIEAEAFYGCELLTDLVFPEGLKQIEAEAFSGCASLRTLVIPEGVARIGEEAFCGCEQLTSVTLPETLLSLGENTFFDCVSLSSIRLPSSLKTLPYGLFTNCTGLAKVEIANGTAVIEAEAFWACEALREVTIPKSVVSIGERAFYQSGLESITFMNGSTSLGYGLFDFCADLATVYVKAGDAAYYQGMLEDYHLEFQEMD